MDNNNNNNNIKFVGYFANGTFKRALKHRENPLELETFYAAVNQPTMDGCCSCCKKETIVFAVMPVGLPIKPSVLQLCDECACHLPMELTVINIDSNGAPPLLIDRQYESQV